MPRARICAAPVSHLMYLANQENAGFQPTGYGPKLRITMSKSRRQFLTHAPLALLGAAVASYGQDQKPAELPPGAPPAFGTAPAVGPQVSPATFAEEIGRASCRERV